MTRIHRCCYLLLVTCFTVLPGGSPAWADFELGVDAYEREDYGEAFHQFALAVGEGDTRAQFDLGNMYRLGKGVEQSWENAVTLYRSAAERGHAGAQNALGTAYAMGKGVEGDDVQAYVWFSLASMLGNEIAKKNLVQARSIVSPRNKALADRMLEQYFQAYAAPFLK